MDAVSNTGKRLLSVSLIVLFFLCMAAQTRKSEAGRRLCVVAVRDSSLFTLCLPDAPGRPSISAGGVFAHQTQEGMQTVRFPNSSPLILPPAALPAGPSIIDRTRPDWDLLARIDAAVCRSGWVDADLQKRFEREFLKRKDYELADSPEKADLIFLVEGLYFHGQVIVNGKSMDRSLQAAFAVAVPSETYLKNPADSDQLIKARLWAGLYRWQISRGSVKPEELAGQFLQKKKWPSEIPPICSAWGLPPGAGAPAGTDIKARALKGGVSGGAPAAVEASAIPPATGSSFKVDVSLVTVPVTASDLSGKFVPDLRRSDFRLFEDDREQRIDRVIPEAQPFNVALLLDVSNSTHFKLADIQTAAMGFVDALRPEDRVMVISFGSRIFVNSEFIGNRSQLRAAILQAQTLGGTRLYDAIDLTVTERLSRVQGRKAIVLYTDGVDSLSRLASFASTLARIEESNVLVSVIQYDTQTDIRAMAGPSDCAQAAQYLASLSSASGGLLVNAATVPSLTEAFTRIAEELRHQYTLCYYPDSVSGRSSFHRIRVEVNRPDVRIRARKGYRAADTAIRK